tara:strand:- start:1626 stop:1940 length:315 start_codon:yes stop_codon:yes gene_type:complete
MHVFCCGLPLAMSLISLGTMVGVTGLQLPVFDWFGRNEPYIMAISGVLLLITGLMLAAAQRINCRTDGHCVHPPCDEKKDYTVLIFTVAVALYAGNSLLQYLAR